MNTSHNKQMQRTSPGQDGGSQLICVFCGPFWKCGLDGSRHNE
jgi:hypothetical protein